MTETERKGVGSTFDFLPFHRLSGKPQESLVLQVYGISEPSQEFKDRLNGIIQRKLDSTVLNIICNLYERNQQLKLTPEDVDFLQPGRKSSQMLHLPLPLWLCDGHQQAFFFYFLQTLSTFTKRPLYTSSENKEHCQFQAHQELQNAYLVEGVTNEVHQDHLFIYIRHHTKGRGMAVLCVSLADSNDKVVAPLPGVTMPYRHMEDVPGLFDDRMECVVSEEPMDTGTNSIKVHIWEKGNIGIEEFMAKLSLCYKHTLLDFYLEFYFLYIPIALLTPKLDSEARGGSPCEEDNTDIDSGKEPVVGGMTRPSNKDNHLVKKGSPPVSEQQKPSKKDSVVSFKSADSSDSASHHGSVRGSKESGIETRPSIDVSGISSDKILKPRQFKQSSKLSEQNIDKQEDSLKSSMPLHKGSGEGNKLLWLQKEKIRRSSEARQTLIKDADMGKSGVLNEAYHSSLPKYLSLAQSLASPSVRYISLPIMGHYSAKVFVSQSVSSIQLECPELTGSVFQLSPTGANSDFTHCIPAKDWTHVHHEVHSHLQETEYIVIFKNLLQWEESCHISSLRHSSNDPLSNLYLFHPLDSRKLYSMPRIPIPLHVLAQIRDVFVPRRIFILLRVTQQKVSFCHS